MKDLFSCSFVFDVYLLFHVLFIQKIHFPTCVVHIVENHASVSRDCGLSNFYSNECATMNCRRKGLTSLQILGKTTSWVGNWNIRDTLICQVKRIPFYEERTTIFSDFSLSILWKFYEEDEAKLFLLIQFVNCILFCDDIIIPISSFYVDCWSPYNNI